MFFGEWLQRREMLSPNKVALIDAINDNQPITYRERNQQVTQLAQLADPCSTLTSSWLTRPMRRSAQMRWATY